MELHAGTLVDDRYAIDAQIGEGGMAVVYRAHHTKLHTRHAVKVLTLASRQIRERMLQEGRVQASLRHPNIVSVTDVITIGQSPALVMELIDGPALDELIVRQKLTIDQADAIGRGILAAVGYAHDKGLIHRDLKPANVMLEIEGTVVTPKVTDFGLAKVLHGDDEARAATRTGSTMGTPQYMSPEQIEDTKNVDERSDVFALGAILYELVTGERAFDGDNILQIFTKVSSCEYVPVRTLRPDAPDRMVAAIERALVADRTVRVGSVQELFELFTAGEPLAAASFSSTAVSAMREVAPPTSVDTLALAPAPTAHSAASIVQSPVVIGGGLFAVGSIVLALVVLAALGGGAAVYLLARDAPTDARPLQGASPPQVAPVPPPAGAEQPAPAVRPEPSAPRVVQPVPGPVAPEPASADRTSEEPPEPVDEPEEAPDEPVDEVPDEEPTDAPVLEEDPSPAPEPVAPVVDEPAPPAPGRKMTIENVPMGMRSDSTSGPATIWNYRDERKERVDQWLEVLVKERTVQSASRQRAVDALAYRWDRGIGSAAVQASTLGWAARFGLRGQQNEALEALARNGSDLSAPIAALGDGDSGVQQRAVEAIQAIAQRTGEEAQARAALEAFLAKGPGGRAERSAQSVLSSL